MVAGIKNFFYPDDRHQIRHCDFCAVPHTIGGPFVEGISHALICGACLRSAIAIQQHSAEGSKSSSAQSEATSTQDPASQNDPSPESKIDEKIASGCSFCGTALSPIAKIGSRKLRICTTCVEDSLDILKHEIQKRTHRSG